MADAVELSVAGVRKNIDKLRNTEILRRVGADKGGYWKIIKAKKK